MYHRQKSSIKFVSKNYKRYLFSKYVIGDQGRDAMRHEESLDAFSQTKTALIYISEKFGYILKLVTLVNILNFNISQIYKHKDQQQSKGSLPQQPSSTILQAPCFSGELCTLPHFLENKENFNPHLLCKVGGDPAIATQNYLFHIFVTANKVSSNKNIFF